MGLGTAVAYLTLDATGFARGIDSAVEDTKRLNTGFRNISNTTTRVGEAVTGVGKVLTAGITAPVVGFGAASIKSGAEFDKSMSDVKAVSMSTQTDMKALAKSADNLGVSYKKGGSNAETAFNALRATAIKMGNDTKFTAKESADALYYMGLAGWSADQSIAGIPAVLSLASAGNTELATTSDIVTDAITGFGHSAQESVSIIRGEFNKEIPVATRLADIMASTMANSNTDVDMLGQSFKYVSPLAGSFGYSMEDVSLSLGLMANAGVKASQAGTTLRQGLKRLVAPTDKAQEVMNKYGWSVSDAQGNIKPLRQQIEELRGIFGKLDIEVVKADGTMKTSKEIMQEYGRKLPVTEQEKLSDAVQVFGTTALPGMLALMGASQDSFDSLANSIDNSSAAFVLHNGKIMTYADAIKKYGEDVVTTSDAFEVLGSAEGMAQIQLDNLNGDFTLFKSALGTTKQILSDMGNGALRDFVQKITSLVRQFNEASPSTQRFVTKIALIGASVGPSLLVLGKLITIIGKVRGAFDALRTAGMVKTAVEKDKLIKNFGNLNATICKTGTGLYELTGGFGNATNGVGAMSAGVAAADGNVAAMSASTGAAAASTKSFGASLAGLISPVAIVVAAIAALVAAFVYLMKTNDEFREKVVGKFKAMWKELKGYFQQMVDAINSLGFNFKDIADVIVGVWKGICDVLAPILQGLITIITNAIDVIFNAITGIVQAVSGVIGLIKGIITGDGEQIKQSVKVLLDGILNIFQTIGKLILLPITGLFEVINNIFGTNLPTTFEDFGNFISEMFNKIGEIILSIVDKIASIPGKILGFFVNVGGMIANVVTGISTTVANFVSGLIDKAKEIGVGFVNAIVSDFVSMAQAVAGIINSIVSFIAGFVSNVAQKAKEIYNKFVKVIIGFFGDLFAGIKAVLTNIIGAITTWVSSMVSKAKEIGTKFLQNIVNGFKQVPIKIGSFIKSAKEKIVSWGTAVINKAKEIGSKFLGGIVNHFKQVPGRIGSFISTAKSTIFSWGSSIVGKAKQASLGFLNNISSNFKKVPSNVGSVLTNALTNVAKFVVNIGKKAIEAGKSLLSNFKKAATNPTLFSDIGSNIVKGVWKGITSVGGWFKEKVSGFFGGMVDKVKGVLGIHSPSTVFEKQVGLNIVLGVAKGIKNNSKHAMNAAKFMVDQVLKTTGKVYDKQYNIAVNAMTKTQNKIDSIEKQIQRTTDKNDKIKLKKQLATLKKQLKNQKQAIKDLQSDYLSYCENQLSQETKLYDLSNKQIVDYWKKVRSHLKKGTKAYKDATAKIVEAQVTMYAEMVSEAEENLSKMQEQRDVSLAEQVKYWEKVRKQCLVGSKAYNEATEKINAANKQLVNGANEAFKTLKDGMDSVALSVKEKVQDIVNNYNDAIASTKETLMGLAGLFESFTVDESTSGDDLLSNLKTQVDGLEQWNAVIDKMFSRGLPEDLIKELQAMGPKAMGSIINLLNMTDQQLSEYVALWDRKNSEAQQAALKMVDRTPYVQQIQQTVDEASKEIEKLVVDYYDRIKELGYKTNDSAKNMSVQFSKNFTESLKQDLSNTDFGFIGDIFSKQKFSNIGQSISKPINEALVKSLQKAVSNAAQSIENSAPEVTEAIQDVVDEKKVDVSGFSNVGVNIVGNITSGAKKQTPLLNKQMQVTGSESQQNFINSIKAKESDVNKEGMQIGMQLDNGMASGIDAYVGNVIAAAVNAVQQAIAAARAAAGIASPSKVAANQIGKWLPLGMAKGFVDYTPQATDDMQNAIDESINSLHADDIEIFPNVKSVGEEVRDAFKDVSKWFSNVSKSVISMTDTMKENIRDVVDITDGMLYNVYDKGSESLNNLISGNNVKTVQTVESKQKGKDDTSTEKQIVNNNYVFNSPKPIDEVQASRLLKQTSRDLAEDFY